jgi:hypothetical protein
MTLTLECASAEAWTLMYERRGQPLLDRRGFVRRLTRHVLVAIAVLLGALGIGIFGYHLVAGLSWVDAVMNAAMILAGMGPVDPIPSTAGKLFAAAYALFSGVVFLVAAGVLVAPLFHRVLHHFHLEIDEEQGQGG